MSAIRSTTEASQFGGTVFSVQLPAFNESETSKKILNWTYVHNKKKSEKIDLVTTYFFHQNSDFFYQDKLYKLQLPEEWNLNRRKVELHFINTRKYPCSFLIVQSNAILFQLTSSKKLYFSDFSFKLLIDGRLYNTDYKFKIVKDPGIFINHLPTIPIEEIEKKRDREEEAFNIPESVKKLMTVHSTESKSSLSVEETEFIHTLVESEFKDDLLDSLIKNNWENPSSATPTPLLEPTNTEQH